MMSETPDDPGPSFPERTVWAEDDDEEDDDGTDCCSGAGYLSFSPRWDPLFCLSFEVVFLSPVCHSLLLSLSLLFPLF